MDNIQAGTQDGGAYVRGDARNFWRCKSSGLMHVVVVRNS